MFMLGANLSTVMAKCKIHHRHFIPYFTISISFYRLLKNLQLVHVVTASGEGLHFPDGFIEWNWNSHFSLMHWLYISYHKYCKTESKEKDKFVLHNDVFHRKSYRNMAVSNTEIFFLVGLLKSSYK